MMWLKISLSGIRVSRWYITLYMYYQVLDIGIFIMMNNYQCNLFSFKQYNKCYFRDNYLLHMILQNRGRVKSSIFSRIIQYTFLLIRLTITHFMLLPLNCFLFYFQKTPFFKDVDVTANKQTTCVRIRKKNNYLVGAAKICLKTGR